MFSSRKVQPAGLNDRQRGDNGVVLRLCRLEYYPWQVLPRRTGSVPPANDWSLANFSRIWWSLGIAARWMWHMQKRKPIPKINGVYHKMLDGRASAEPANGEGQLVQSAKLLQPSVVLARTVCTSYRKTMVHVIRPIQ